MEVSTLFRGLPSKLLRRLIEEPDWPRTATVTGEGYRDPVSESPALLDRVDARRREVQSGLDPATQAQLGQHLTNAPTAAFMAGLFRLSSSGTFRLLDPGAGSGALTAAVVARVLDEAPGVTVDVTVVEADPAMVPALRETLAECERAAADAGVDFTATVVEGSFIDTAADLGTFDAVIQNPPYGKLAARSADRLAAARQTVDCPNVYAAFVALSVASLRPGGQLVAITPRSFTTEPTSPSSVSGFYRRPRSTPSISSTLATRCSRTPAYCKKPSSTR